MVSVRAKGWLGFKYYGPKLHELKLRSGGGFGNKNKIVPYSAAALLLK